MVGKRKWAAIAALVLLAVGFGVLFYPQLHELFYQWQIDQVKREFMRSISADDASYDALYEMLRQENEDLFATGQSGLVDAFSYEQPAVDLSEHGILDNCIGFINIPSIEY